jgi:hypothetical protein
LRSAARCVENRIFYFGSLERNDQRAVGTTTVLAPEFAHLSRISSSPFLGMVFSGRIDANINSAHTVFVRYSQDASAPLVLPPRLPVDRQTPIPRTGIASKQGQSESCRRDERHSLDATSTT